MDDDEDRSKKSMRMRRESLSVVLLHERRHLQKMETVIGTTVYVNKFKHNLKAALARSRAAKVLH